MEQDENLPFIDEHEAVQMQKWREGRFRKAVGLDASAPEYAAKTPYQITSEAIDQALYRDDPITAEPLRWYHQGALGAYFARIWRRSTSSLSELLSTMR